MATMNEISHIVQKNGSDYRIADVEARSMVSQLQNQVGNIDLSNLDLDFELPEDAEFNTVKIEKSITIGNTQISKNQFSLLLDFAESVVPIEGVYF